MSTIKLPPGTFADNTERRIRTTEAGGIHTLHVNVDSLPDDARQIADGGDVAQGSIHDPAVTTDAPGTVSGKLRGLVKILASVWDSFHGRLRVDASGTTVPVAVQSQPLPAGAATEETLAQLVSKVSTSADGIRVSIESIPPAMQYALASMVRPIWVEPNGNRININTINTMTQLTGLGGFGARETLLFATDRAVWAQAIRSRIS